MPARWDVWWRRPLALLLASSLVAVDVTEYVVITRFGHAARVIRDPGLYLKRPYPLEAVTRLDRRLLTFKPTTAEYLSADKKNLVIHGMINWRIAAPERYLASLGDRETAERRINDLVIARLGAVIGTYPSTALVSVGTQRSDFDAVIERAVDTARVTARGVYGVELVDVWVRQIGLPEQNRANVFSRMQAERGKIATQYRSEGEREFKKLIAAADREKTRVMAEAHREAERTRAEGDAQAMRIYADAFGKNRSSTSSRAPSRGTTSFWMATRSCSFRPTRKSSGSSAAAVRRRRETERWRLSNRAASRRMGLARRTRAGRHASAGAGGG